MPIPPVPHHDPERDDDVDKDPNEDLNVPVEDTPLERQPGDHKTDNQPNT